MTFPRYLLAISFDNTLRKSRVIFCGKISIAERFVLVRTDIGRQAEGIVTAGGLLPDEMMLDLITTKLDTLKENARIFRFKLS